MREVRIDKADLRARVQENRDKHREVYEKAFDGYTKAAIAFFERELAKARAGERFHTVFSEPMPEDHTADYDEALDMLDMSVDDEIVLSQQEFKQYVRDDWGWKRTFMATSANYLSDNAQFRA